MLCRDSAALWSRCSITRLSAAHPSSPVVPRIKPQTMILSLLLSRWKHMVTTSSSFASLQKSMPWLRQNDLVHSEQEVDKDRGATLLDRAPGRIASACAAMESPDPSRESEKRDRRARREESDCWLLGPRGTMVLFLKHVHLQKTGAAGEEGQWWDGFLRRKREEKTYILRKQARKGMPGGFREDVSAPSWGDAARMDGVVEQELWRTY